MRRNKPNLSALLLLVSALGAATLAAESPASVKTAQAPSAGVSPGAVKDILKTIDSINRFSDSFTALMRIASYSPGDPPVLTSYRMYSKGLRKSLMVYLEPAKDVGKKIAMNGESIWFYFPKAKQAMLIRPMNTLTGSIAVGDLIGEPVLELYDFAESADAGDGGLMLAFTAKGQSSPYGRIEYEYRDGRITSQKSYARSGILLKTASFIEFKSVPGGSYATKIKVQNAVYPEYYSLIQISDLKKVDSIPDFYFTPEGLADAGNPAQ